MRSLTVYTYLVDEDGNYILTEAGDRIILGTGLELEYDESFTALAGAVAGIPHLYSFDVLWSESMSEWRLFVNKQTLIGRYSSRPQAVGVLVGLFTRLGSNNDDKLIEVISHMLSTGSSVQEDSLPLSTAYFSYGVSLNGDVNPYYMADDADVEAGRTPDNDMQQVIDLMNGGNARLVMIYPDSGSNGTISTDAASIWKNFDIDTWNGVDALPQMNPAEYVAACQEWVDNGSIATADGVAFCFDWESGSLEVTRKGSIFWNDTSAPQYRAALIEYRTQQKAIYDACKAAFPKSFFGTYGGTVDVGQNELQWDGSAFTVGSSAIRWMALCDSTQEAVLAQNFRDAIAGSEQPWDYTTKVCYDYLAPDSIQQFIDNPAGDATALKPPYIKTLNTFAFNLMKSELEAPALAIVSPSNYARASYGTTFNNLSPYEWATPLTWVAQTLDFIRDAEGYLIWDGLRVDQMRQFTQNYNDWAQVVSIGTDAQFNDWWNLMEDLEEKFGTLSTIATQFSVAAPTTAEEWFNIPRATRQTDFVRNLMLKDVTDSLKTDLIPLAETWRTTGVVPFVERNPSSITGTATVGSTLTAVADFVGDFDEVTYAWSAGSSTGTDATFVVPADAAGSAVTCTIKVRRSGADLSSTVATTGTVPAPIAGTITPTVPNVFASVKLSSTGWATLSDSPYDPANAFNALTSGVTFNFASFGGAHKASLSTSSSISFVIDGGASITVSPSLADGTVLAFTDSALITPLLSGATELTSITIN